MIYKFYFTVVKYDYHYDVICLIIHIQIIVSGRIQNSFFFVLELCFSLLHDGVFIINVILTRKVVFSIYVISN